MYYLYNIKIYISAHHHSLTKRLLSKVLSCCNHGTLIPWVWRHEYLPRRHCPQTKLKCHEDLLINSHNSHHHTNNNWNNHLSFSFCITEKIHGPHRQLPPTPIESIVHNSNGSDHSRESFPWAQDRFHDRPLSEKNLSVLDGLQDDFIMGKWVKYTHISFGAIKIPFTYVSPIPGVIF
jgi:hypothetical protein